ncbi:MAG: methylenetetrahydrofolate--tRNA-(uracil(54)-C(5))-methyltransferase (FADH(2)-oxidizing) TrmFO [Anaerolineae bacterium]|nr:methylenetetrahydrofolate--tRNA-(uracil(54)-C(5))-methyltransferase (FADH(2)-oxidizing) TrmFO [Anaerolineae bacterium]
MSKDTITVIGAGLAGSEASWQIASRGVAVHLYEMRPGQMTPAHTGADFAELVCSNSLGSNLRDRASGLLKEEMRRLGSLILEVADGCAVPAGGALAVDRESFSRQVTERVSSHPLITVMREEVKHLPSEGVTVVAAGPLASDDLVRDILRVTGASRIAFFDAMAPIVTAESLDFSIAFRAGRYEQEDDYINCPLSEEEYDRFVSELAAAETAPLRSFEAGDERFFEACLPVEVMARRGRLVLAHGPLRPVGLTDPRTGRRPFAVVQLRQDNAAATLYNMVGFQTNLRYREQDRVFRLIPGLERAEFVRYGQMHRNTFVDSPRLLEATFQLRGRPGLFFAGQLTGTEGYVASAASGLVAGLNAARVLLGTRPVSFPPETMIGALSRYISHEAVQDFQPMKPNFGLMPPLEGRLKRQQRYAAYADRSLSALEQFIATEDLLPKGATV